MRDSSEVSAEVVKQPKEQAPILTDFDIKCEEYENSDENEDLDESKAQDESEDMGM